MYDEDTGSFPHEFMPVATKGPLPGLLVAHAPWASAKVDTVYIEKSLTAGRAGSCGLEMWDSMLSRHHFTIENKGEECSITDPGSKNGTFVNSHRVLKEMILEDQDVIRAGETLVSNVSGTATGEPKPIGITTLLMCLAPRHTPETGRSRARLI